MKWLTKQWIGLLLIANVSIPIYYNSPTTITMWFIVIILVVALVYWLIDVLRND